jgi:hypothetical protein
MASELTKKVHGMLKNNLLNASQVDVGDLNEGLRLLSKWRSVLIQNTLVGQENTQIHRGPFKGMEFLAESSEGCHVAKLLGTYEQPLHPHINSITAKPYKRVINVGCAEGYYAIGLALLMNNTEILAYDTNHKAQEACQMLAKKNSVTDRVSTFGELNPADLTTTLLEGSIILCDIEGAEAGLLNPEISPALKDVDLIVESHECLVPGITKILRDRFEETHDIEEISDDGMREIENPPQWFNELSHLDQLLATWEWRAGPTPWLVMQSKTRE